MPRKTKKGTIIYKYLEDIGLLENGSSESIQQAKEQFWKERRKALKKIQRKQRYSYTIFFEGKDYRLLKNAACIKLCSINSIIKNTCLHSLRNTAYIDLKTIAQIRAWLVLFYEELRCVEQFNTNGGNSLSTKFEVLENHILSTLKSSSTLPHDY